MIQKLRYLLLFMILTCLPFGKWEALSVSHYSAISILLLLFNFISIFDITSKRSNAVFNNTQIKCIAAWMILVTIIDLFASTKGFTKLPFSHFNTLLSFYTIYDMLTRTNAKQFLILIVAFLLSMAAIFPLFSLGYGVSYEQINQDLGESRFTIFGNDNGIAMLADVCIFITIFIATRIRKLWCFIIGILLLSSYIGIIITVKSKGALIGLLIGLFLYICVVLFGKSKFSVKLVFGILASAFLIVLFQFVLSNEAYMDRFISSDVSTGRFDLYKIHLQSFGEAPLFGSGTLGHGTLMANKYNMIYQSHNCFIDLLTFSGIVGFTLFMFSVLKSLIALFKSRRTNQFFVITLIFFFLLFFDFAKSGGFLLDDAFWIQFAILNFLCIHWLNLQETNSEYITENNH